MTHLYTKAQRQKKTSLIWLRLAMGIAVILFLVLLADKNAKMTADKQASQLLLAVNAATVNCYAIEGVYPPNLQYLIKNYGVVVDDANFLVTYEAFGSNVRPDIHVIARGSIQ